MTEPGTTPYGDDDRDVARVSMDLAGRLRALGVEVHDDDSAEAIVGIVEAVEAFEHAVRAQGGDLMMDEPPANQAGEPDDPHFLLPSRGADESSTDFATRLAATTAGIRKHKPHS